MWWVRRWPLEMPVHQLLYEALPLVQLFWTTKVHGKITQQREESRKINKPGKFYYNYPRKLLNIFNRIAFGTLYILILFCSLTLQREKSALSKCQCVPNEMGHIDLNVSNCVDVLVSKTEKGPWRKRDDGMIWWIQLDWGVGAKFESRSCTQTQGNNTNRRKLNHAWQWLGYPITHTSGKRFDIKYMGKTGQEWLDIMIDSRKWQATPGWVIGYGLKWHETF